MNPWLWWLGPLVIGRHHHVGVRFALSQPIPTEDCFNIGWVTVVCACVCVCVCTGGFLLGNTPWKEILLWWTQVIIITTLCILRNIRVTGCLCRLDTLRHVHTPFHMYTHTHCTLSYRHTYAAGYVKKEKPVLKQRCVIMCCSSIWNPCKPFN